MILTIRPRRWLSGWETGPLQVYISPSLYSQSHSSASMIFSVSGLISESIVFQGIFTRSFISTGSAGQAPNHSWCWHRQIHPSTSSVRLRLYPSSKQCHRSPKTVDTRVSPWRSNGSKFVITDNSIIWGCVSLSLTMPTPPQLKQKSFDSRRN